MLPLGPGCRIFLTVAVSSTAWWRAANPLPIPWRSLVYSSKQYIYIYMIQTDRSVLLLQSSVIEHDFSKSLNLLPVSAVRFRPGCSSTRDYIGDFIILLIIFSILHVVSIYIMATLDLLFPSAIRIPIPLFRQSEMSSSSESAMALVGCSISTPAGLHCLFRRSIYSCDGSIFREHPFMLDTCIRPGPRPACTPGPGLASESDPKPELVKHQCQCLSQAQSQSYILNDVLYSY